MINIGLMKITGRRGAAGGVAGLPHRAAGGAAEGHPQGGAQLPAAERPRAQGLPEARRLGGQEPRGRSPRRKGPLRGAYLPFKILPCRLRSEMI